MKKLILASSSPRRTEILKNLNLTFEVIPSKVDENIDETIPDRVVRMLAELKAKDVADMSGEEDIIVGADTIVFKDGKIYGKPSCDEEAFAILKELSGSCHSVMTGLCIIDNSSGKLITGVEETTVFFKELKDSEIEKYIKTGEHRDKAGAYGIQGVGSLLVEKIHGCYFNVVGLPINKFYRLMEKVGVNLMDEVTRHGN